MDEGPSLFEQQSILRLAQRTTLENIWNSKCNTSRPFGVAGKLWSKQGRELTAKTSVIDRYYLAHKFPFFSSVETMAACRP